MQQKYKVLSFAIIAALYMFLVPSTSQANFNHTHTPGETVGPASRPPIACRDEDCGKGSYMEGRTGCTKKLVEADLDIASKMMCWPSDSNVGNPPDLRCGWDKVGLGTKTRYIQSTGGYCYYYKGGSSSGASGYNTWRYDSCSMNCRG